MTTWFVEELSYGAFFPESTTHRRRFDPHQPWQHVPSAIAPHSVAVFADSVLAPASGGTGGGSMSCEAAVRFELHSYHMTLAEYGVAPGGVLPSYSCV